MTTQVHYLLPWEPRSAHQVVCDGGGPGQTAGPIRFSWQQIAEGMVLSGEVEVLRGWLANLPDLPELRATRALVRVPVVQVRAPERRPRPDHVPPGSWIAWRSGLVVDHDNSHRALADRVRARADRVGIAVEFGGNT
jgi:hypothetical protein